MSYTKREFGFSSSDGKNTVMATVCAPDNGEVRGVVQLSHGMIDYVGRYEGLAEFLTSAGFVFAGNEHLGHGRSAASADDSIRNFAPSATLNAVTERKLEEPASTAVPPFTEIAPGVVCVRFLPNVSV